MTASHRATVAAACFALAVSCPLAAEHQEWSFSAVERVDLDGVSGDVLVRPSGTASLRITVDWDVTPRGSFRADVEARGEVVDLRERWGADRSQGGVSWILELPDRAGTEIAIRSSSGDLEVTGVRARFDFRSASGEVELERATVLSGSRFETSSGDFVVTDTEIGESVELDTSSGDLRLVRVNAGRDFRFSTSSGDVLIEDSPGVLEGESSSGDVRVLGDEIAGAARFFSSSGDVTLRFLRLPSHDLELSSSSGEVRLEVGEFPDDFTIQLSKREDRGRIEVPFDISSERSFSRNGQKYEEKTVQHGSGGPTVRMHTASGSVVVRRE